MAEARPIDPDVMLLDDRPDFTVENGIRVPTPARRTNLDFLVVKGSGEGFGPGDRVVIDDPQAGRKIMLDRVPYRMVPRSHVIAVVG